MTKSIYLPYTYLVGWSYLDKWYYGCRFARGCHPSDLLNPYATSSRRVKEFIKLHGEPDVVEIRNVFDDSSSARMWEHRVLKRLKVVQQDKWLNETDNKSISLEKCAARGFQGKRHTIETRLLMSWQRKGVPKSKQHSAAISKGKIDYYQAHVHVNKGKKLQPHSEETKLKISLANQGKKKTQKQKEFLSSLYKGKTFRELHGKNELAIRKKMAEAHLGNETAAKQYKITFPDGKTQVIKNLTKFCREYSLTVHYMYEVARGTQCTHKGFKCKRFSF